MNDEFKQQIIAEARTWIGTPWMHNQRLKGVGVDCVQFLAALADHFNINHGDVPTIYPRLQTNDNLLIYLNSHFTFKTEKLEETELTNILLFRYAGHPHHVGLLTELNGNKAIIHAFLKKKRVVEHEIDNDLRRRFICAFDWEKVKEDKEWPE